MKRATIVFCARALLLAGAAFSWSRGPWQIKSATKPAPNTSKMDLPSLLPPPSISSTCSRCPKWNG